MGSSPELFAFTILLLQCHNVLLCSFFPIFERVLIQDYLIGKLGDRRGDDTTMRIEEVGEVITVNQEMEDQSN